MDYIQCRLRRQPPASIIVEGNLMRLLFVFFGLGPSLAGFSLAYLLRRPEDWPAPAAMLAVGLLMTVLTQTLGMRWLASIVIPRYKIFLTTTRWSGLAMGGVIGLLAYFVLLA